MLYEWSSVRGVPASCFKDRLIESIRVQSFQYCFYDCLVSRDGSEMCGACVMWRSLDLWLT